MLNMSAVSLYRTINLAYFLKVVDIQGGPKKLRQIFLAITLVNMDRF